MFHNIQWNPDFSNPRFFKPPDFSNHISFPLEKRFDKFTPISRTPDFLNRFWLPFEVREIGIPV